MRFALLPWLLASGCDVQTVQFLPDLWATEWEDSGVLFPRGNLSFDYDRVRFSCDGQAQAWTLEAYTRGPASGGELILTREGGPTERHDLVLTEASPDGRWDLYRTGPLADGVPDAAFVANANTRFDCLGPPPSVAVTLFDRFDALADCVVFGPSSVERDQVLANEQAPLIGDCVELFIF